MNGCGELPISQRARLDAKYFDKYLFAFDVDMLWVIIKKVLAVDGVFH